MYTKVNGSDIHQKRPINWLITSKMGGRRTVSVVNGVRCSELYLPYLLQLLPLPLLPAFPPYRIIDVVH